MTMSHNRLRFFDTYRRDVLGEPNREEKGEEYRKRKCESTSRGRKNIDAKLFHDSVGLDNRLMFEIYEMSIAKIIKLRKFFDE